MNTPVIPTYSLDNTGVHPDNLITDEQQVLTSVAPGFQQLVIPAYAPFFEDNFELKYTPSGGPEVTLQKNVDYLLTHWFIGASRAIGKNVYGSISIMDPDLVGSIKVTYQTLGGTWVLDSATIANILANQLGDSRTVAWEQVAGYPENFPPIPHEWNVNEMFGQEQVVEALNGVEDAIRERSLSAYKNHVTSLNAHHVTSSTINTYDREQINQLITAISRGNQINITLAAETDIPLDDELFFSNNH